MSEAAFKVIVSVPEDFLEMMMDAIDSVMEPFYPGYRRCFSIADTVGTWIPVEGSSPYIGTLGKKEYVREKRIEFLVRECDLKKVVSVISEKHPYEEPAIDVIPCIGWKSVL